MLNSAPRTSKTMPRTINLYLPWTGEFVSTALPVAGRALTPKAANCAAATRGSNGRYAIVYTVDGGLIRRAQVYATPEEALVAAGLSE
jgi:hypothetical protein